MPSVGGCSEMLGRASGNYSRKTFLVVSSSLKILVDLY